MTVRPCLGYPGYRCNRLIQGGSRCVDCQRATYRIKNATRPQFEIRIYSSSAWKRLRDQVMAEADGVCHWCGATDVELSADHVRTVREYPELALEPSNVVAACRSCQRQRQNR